VAGRASATAPEQAPAAPPLSTDAAYLSHPFEPLPPLTLSSWDISRIREARDAHVLGQFQASAVLADALMTDGRIYQATTQRIGPPLGIAREVIGGSRWNGKGLTETVRVGVQEILLGPGPAPALGPATLAPIFLSLAVMGVCILQVIRRPRADGSRIDVELRPWPLQQAYWNEAIRRYVLFSTDGPIEVTPNDGKWIVIEPWGPRSFKLGAIRALALLWADRAYAQRDRSNHSAAHGSVNIVGTLPEGVKVRSPEGAAFRDAVRLLQQARSGIILPDGSKVAPFEPQTQASKIFDSIIDSDNGDIALCLLGILPGGDGTYKPIPQLDGVRYDLVRLDIGAAESQLQTGLVRPVTAWNWGDDPELVPAYRWLVPDPREIERVDAEARHHAALSTTLQAYRGAGLLVDQPLVNRLAARFGISPAPLLDPNPPQPAAAAPDPFAPPPAPTG
jgi:hypothetical protein